MAEQLDGLYKEIILDHFRRPRNQGALATPPASHSRGFNPLCGDEVDVYVIVDPEDRIAELKFEGKGCAISQASASMLTELVSGKSVEHFQDDFQLFRAMLGLTEDAVGEDEATHFDPDAQAGTQLGDAEALQSVRAFPSRIKCATLGWNTLHRALDGAGDFTEH